MVSACGDDSEKAAWLIVDHPTIRRYGLGFVKPFPVPLTPALQNGYLIKGRTLRELAEKVGINPAAFEQTVETYNRDARRGEDPQFKRGSTAYNRYLGDPDHKPNPCVGPIARGPFYAVKVVPGDLGTFAGLKTDADARVIDENGNVIPGLYAAGNDMASIMGGNYPGGGITLGPAMTFGFIAGRHLAGVGAEAASTASRPAA
jgi:succinate dehydrogenase/fumarate reductase flavoprotein subunit